MENLSEYMKQGNPDYRIKDALLQWVGRIFPTLALYAKFNDNVEGILREAVFQDLRREDEAVQDGIK